MEVPNSYRKKGKVYRFIANIIPVRAKYGKPLVNVKRDPALQNENGKINSNTLARLYNTVHPILAAMQISIPSNLQPTITR